MSQVTALPRVPQDTLAIRLLAVRHELGWSQRDAAEHTGVPYGTWQGMESGRETRNLGEHIANIARVTGYRRDWLMWGGPMVSDSDPHPEGEAGQLPEIKARGRRHSGGSMTTHQYPYPTAA
jgi:transcriptional regulator with XRE-family HTH domain